jgi:hypothetical protein
MPMLTGHPGVDQWTVFLLIAALLVARSFRSAKIALDRYRRDRVGDRDQGPIVKSMRSFTVWLCYALTRSCDMSYVGIHCVMNYKAPDFDRIAKEGVAFV